jgi:hypothetical protein
MLYRAQIMKLLVIDYLNPPVTSRTFNAEIEIGVILPLLHTSRYKQVK